MVISAFKWKLKVNGNFTLVLTQNQNFKFLHDLDQQKIKGLFYQLSINIC